MASSFLKEQAADEDFRLARQLDAVDWFFELNLDGDEILRSQELFGQLARTELRFDQQGLIREYPALTLVSLIGHASLGYDQGVFWETFWDAVGLEPDPDFAGVLRHRLYRLLRSFQMQDCPELLAESRYIQVMALHAGIPINCLGDLIDLIDEHVQRGRDATGVAFLEWLLEPGMEYRLNRLDVPVRHFLQLGGVVAVDMVDRIVVFLLSTLQNSEPWNDLTLDTASTGLPTVILDGLIDRLRLQPFGAAIDKSVKGSRCHRPAIWYSVEDSQVMVGVPYPSVGGESAWSVTIAGDTRQVYAERGWGIADDDESPHTPVAVTAPAREVLMRHDASGEHHRVVVVDSADPLLLFTAGGRIVKSRSALPRDQVIALFPKDGTIVDAATGQEVEVDGADQSPSGWPGWTVRYLDLSGHDAIQLKRGDDLSGSIRGVRSVGSPRIHLADPVVGLRSLEGLRVYAQPPEIALPPHIGTTPVTWRVRARESGRTYWLTDHEWESDAVEVWLDPFEGASHGLLGLYDIWVSGPMGSDQRYSVFLAEGIELDHGVTFREPIVQGLQESVTVASCAAPLTCDSSRLPFGVADRDKTIQINSGARGYRLVVTPPHFEARVDLLGAPAQWRSSPQVLAPADLGFHAVVAARIPGDIAASIVLLDDRGKVIQDEYPETPADNVFQVPTRAFVDTARRLGTCQLAAAIDEAGDTRFVTIANIRPARLCRGVRLDRRGLVFDGLANEAHLGAWVWASTAPWRPVSRLEIHNNRATLPDELRDGGDLVVQVFVDDPWITIKRPSAPDTDTAVRVGQDGWVADENPVLDALARFLAEQETEPLHVDAVPGAWAALAMMSSDAIDPSTERVRSGLLRILTRYPRAALEALGHAAIAPERKMAMLIRTDLARRPYSASQTLNELHSDPWFGCMVEISDLPSLYERRTAVTTERSETIGYLQTQGGSALMSLLGEGVLGSPAAGLLDANVVAMDGMGPERIVEIFEAVNLVPGALLDADSRASAVADVFHRRSAWSREPACGGLPAQVELALQSVKAVAPPLYDLIETRSEVLKGVDVAELPWMLVSMQSLVLAMVARLDAYGEFESSPISNSLRSMWAALADYFPALVANDLLIAEAAVTYFVHNDLIGEPA